MNIMRGRRLKAVIVAGLLVLALPIAVACGGPGATEAEFRVMNGNVEWRPDADADWAVLATGTQLSGIVTAEVDPMLIASFTTTITELGTQIVALQMQIAALEAGGGGGATLNVTDTNGRQSFVELVNQGATFITASGAGFTGGETITLTCGTTELASATTNDDGSVFFGEEIELPSNAFDATDDGAPNAYNCSASTGSVMGVTVLNVEDKDFN